MSDINQGSPKSRADGKRNSDFHIQVACVTLAKGANRRHFAVSDENSPRQRRCLALGDKDSYAKSFKTKMFNTIVCFNADAGKLNGAENWMEKLNAKTGIEPEVHSFNTLLISFTKAGEHDKAEKWFARCGTPALHPELVGMCPTAESYNIMIQMFTKADEIRKAEKWFLNTERDMQIRPTLASQLSLIKACLRLHESRRAHQWAKYLIENGCQQNENYAPEFVKAERFKFHTTWEWNVSSLTDTLLAVVEALAALGNSHTADEWLRYLVGCGLKPEEAYSTWEKVRKVHPKEIISTILSGEQADPCSPGLPPRTKMATLFGEGHRRGSSIRKSIDARPMSQQSARAGTSPRSQSSMSARSGKMLPRMARPSLSDSGRRSGAESPSLRKFLDAKNKGAFYPEWSKSSSNPKNAWAAGPAQDAAVQGLLDGNTEGQLGDTTINVDGPNDAPAVSLPDSLPAIQSDSP